MKEDEIPHIQRPSNLVGPNLVWLQRGKVAKREWNRNKRIHGYPNQDTRNNSSNKIQEETQARCKLRRQRLNLRQDKLNFI